MPTRIESLGIDRLSVQERLELIEEIWDSLPEQVEPPDVPTGHLAERARRRADAEATPIQVDRARFEEALSRVADVEPDERDRL